MGTVVDDELCLHDDGLVLLVVVERIVDGDNDDSGGDWFSLLERWKQS